MSDQFRTFRHMQLTTELRRALRLMDGSPENLRQVHAPAMQGDLLHGSFDDRATFHAVPVVMVCLEGPLQVRFRRKTCNLSAGDVVLIPQATWHVWAEPATRGSGFGVGWLGDRADLWLFGAGVSWWWATMPLEPVRSRLREAASAPSHLRLEAVRSLLRSVIEEDHEAFRTVSPAIESMLNVILRRLHHGPKVAELVRASGLGRSQAYAAFTAFYGISPRRALEVRRMELAEALLSAGTGVSETAIACGWRNRETFSRAWSRHHGAPPRVTRGNKIKN